MKITLTPSAYATTMSARQNIVLLLDQLSRWETGRVEVDGHVVVVEARDEARSREVRLFISSSNLERPRNPQFYGWNSERELDPSLWEEILGEAKKVLFDGDRIHISANSSVAVDNIRTALLEVGEMYRLLPGAPGSLQISGVAGPIPVA